MVIPDYTSAQVFDQEGKEVKRFKESPKHYENFVDAVRSRKHTDLHADILEGHLSSALCHTGNISYQLGKAQSPDEIRDALKNNKDLAEAYGRMEEHLAANKVDYNTTPLKLGVALTMDPRTERFTSNDEANMMLTREYRKPYVVPEKV